MRTRYRISVKQEWSNMKLNSLANIENGQCAFSVKGICVEKRKESPSPLEE